MLVKGSARLRVSQRRRPALLVLGAIAMASFGCAAAPAEEAPTAERREPIAGGTPVSADGWPNVVWLDMGCTGVLVDEDTVLYAAHCGIDAKDAWFGSELNVFVDADANIIRLTNPESAVRAPIDYCRSHPDPVLGEASDIAFCRLKEPAIDRARLPTPLLGCERSQLEIGQAVTMVGHGFDPATSSIGAKLVTQAPLTWELNTLIAGEPEHGTCFGDSGSPLFVRTNQLLPEWKAEWRLAGVLSSGPAGEACGTGRYADLSRALGWLEAETRRDLSPCFDPDGTWAPTPRCRSALLDANGLPLADGALEFSATCGAPFQAESEDTTAPSIEQVSVKRRAPFVDVFPEVGDEGWGVERVTVELLDTDGATLARADSEIPPYTLEGVLLAAGARFARVTARDYAGLTTSREQSLPDQADGGGCGVSTAVASERHGAWLTLLLAGAASLQAVRRRSAKRWRTRQTS